MYNLLKKDGKFDLYFKFNNKFVLANDSNVKEFMKILNNKKTRKKGGSNKKSRKHKSRISYKSKR